MYYPAGETLWNGGGNKVMPQARPNLLGTESWKIGENLQCKGGVVNHWGHGW